MTPVKLAVTVLKFVFALVKLPNARSSSLSGISSMLTLLESGSSDSLGKCKSLSSKSSPPS